MTAHLLDLGRGLLGLGVFVLVLWLLSDNRARIPWKLVGAGLALQLVFAVATLHVPFFRDGMEGVAAGFVRVLQFSSDGAAFLFGGLVTDKKSFGFIFAFQVLPTIIFFSAFTSALYYLGILQRIVFGLAWVMSRTMRLSGAESLNAAGNIFVGQTEAPLLIRPYLEKMTRSELLCVMVGGMATIAGGVMAAYVGLLGGPTRAGQELIALHLLTASILSAPAAVVCAKLLVPESEPIDQQILIPREQSGANLLEAIANGTTAGLKLAFNVGAMLIVFTALIALCNWVIAAGLGGWTGLSSWATELTGGRYTAFNLQFLLGLVFAPVAWLIGVDGRDLILAGQILGEKTVLNEFFAYTTLGKLMETGVIADPTTIIALTYALCGFSNFASIGIQIGGISALAPGRRSDLARLGLRALLGGSVACFMTASIALMVL